MNTMQRTRTRTSDSVRWRRTAATLALLLAAGAPPALGGEDHPTGGRDGLLLETPATDASTGLPVPAALQSLAFVENRGQWDTPAGLVGIAGTTAVHLLASGFAVEVRPAGEEPLLLRFELEGARAGLEPVGREPLPGVRNYFTGSDPEHWGRGARSFARACYPDVHDGIDLELRDGDGLLEYDVRVAPGADVSSLVLRCEGVLGLEIDEHGGLLMRTAQGTLRQSPPETWSVLPSGERERLECEFVVLDRARFGFRLAEPPLLPVVIDPGLEWATFLGGSANDYAMSVARKPNGELVVAGVTVSPTFPFFHQHGNPTDTFNAFVSVLSADGTDLLHSAVFGGSDQDGALDVGVDAAGNVYLTGWTWSVDFPVTGDAYMSVHQGGQLDAFVVELNQVLSGLVYSSYLGGEDSELGNSLHVREPRVLTIAGGTRSQLLPVTPGAYQENYAGGDSDVFVCRLDLDQPPASQLLYCTLLGGAAREANMSASLAPRLRSVALHVDDLGRITLAGRTSSGDFPTQNAFEATYDGSWDGYLARLDPALVGSAQLVYSTYLNGKSQLNDGVQALDVDAAGVATLGGWTASADFPVTPGAYQVGFQGNYDGFLLRLDPSLPPAAQLLYATFLGGDVEEHVRDLALAPDGTVLAVGFTGEDVPPAVSNSFPTTCGSHQEAFAGVYDGYVVHMDLGGNGADDLLYSSFVGGVDDDQPEGLAVVGTMPVPSAAVCGFSDSDDFPTTPGAYQPILAGNRDAVVFVLEASPSITCATSYCTAGVSASGCQVSLAALGLASATAASGFQLTASGVEGGKDGLFFFGNNGRQANPWGNGTSYQCVVPPVKRAGLLASTGTNGACDGSFSQDLTALWTANPNKNPGAGATVQAQLWYRDPLNTSNQTTSLSDAIEFRVGP